MKKIVYMLIGLILLLLLLSVISCAEPENSVQNFPDAPEITQITGSRQFIVGGVSKAYICEVQINNHDFYCGYTTTTQVSIDLTHKPDCKKCNK